MKFQVRNKAQLYDSNQEEVANEFLMPGHVFKGAKKQINEQDVVLIDKTNGFFVAAHNVVEVDPEEIIKQKAAVHGRKYRKLLFALVGGAFGYYIGYALSFGPKGKGLVSVLGIIGGLLYAFKVDTKEDLKTAKKLSDV